MIALKKAVVLAIGGSDSGGGAGIQADIKTITVCGAYATTAITAITAQNTQGVQKIKLLDPEMVRAQIRSVLDDFEVTCIKIGMLGSTELVAAVADEITDSKIRLVLDPVMIAKGGAKLLQDDATDILKQRLLPMSFLLTPNIPEAEVLTGTGILNEGDQRRSAETLLDMGAQAVLIKGGHMPGDTVKDVLLWQNAEVIFQSKRIDTRHTHGTGCTLASAIAAYVAQGLQLNEAVRLARLYVQNAILHAPGLGHGYGPLEHLQAKALVPDLIRDPCGFAAGKCGDKDV